MTRLREVQGSLMVAALFEVFLGVTGAVGGLLRFIGELLLWFVVQKCVATAGGLNFNIVVGLFVGVVGASGPWT